MVYQGVTLLLQIRPNEDADVVLTVSLIQGANLVILPNLALFALAKLEIRKAVLSITGCVVIMDQLYTVAMIFLRTPRREEMDGEWKQVLYHTAPIISSCLAVRGLKKARILEELAALPDSATVPGTPSSERSTPARSFYTYPKRSSKCKYNVERALCLACAVIGVIIIGEALATSTRCEEAWDAQLGGATKCAYPKLWFGDAMCGRGRITTIQCPNKNLGNLPAGPSYADLAKLKCIDGSNNPQLDRIPRRSGTN